MGCNFKRLFKKPKVFLRITGVSVEEFEKIVKMAEPIWKEKVEQIKVVSGRPYGLESLEGHMSFNLSPHLSNSRIFGIFV